MRRIMEPSSSVLTGFPSGLKCFHSLCCFHAYHPVSELFKKDSVWVSGTPASQKSSKAKSLLLNPQPPWHWNFLVGGYKGNLFLGYHGSPLTSCLHISGASPSGPMRVPSMSSDNMQSDNSSPIRHLPFSLSLAPLPRGLMCEAAWNWPADNAQEVPSHLSLVLHSGNTQPIVPNPQGVIRGSNHEFQRLLGPCCTALSFA